MFKQAGLFLGFCCALALAACAFGGGSQALAAENFPLGAYSAAGFTVTFADGGKYTVRKGEEVLVEGRYEVEGNRLRLTDEGGPMACEPAEMKTGVYNWKLDGGALTLTAVEDKCEGRSAALTGQAWTRGQ